MADPIHAPWNQHQVDMLNKRQADRKLHPYTCPGISDEPQCTGQRELLATPSGWVCNCGAYRQDWFAA